MIEHSTTGQKDITNWLLFIRQSTIINSGSNGSFVGISFYSLFAWLYLCPLLFRFSGFASDAWTEFKFFALCQSIFLAFPTLMWTVLEPGGSPFLVHAFDLSLLWA